MKLPRKPLQRWLLAAAAVVCTGVGVWLILMPGPGTGPAPVAYDNVSRNYKTCLLDTSATPAADPTWPAIQRAAQGRPINAQHVTAPAGSDEQLAPYANQLVAQHCDLIITNGTELTGTAAKLGTANPALPLITIGAKTGLPNATALTATTKDNADTLIRLIIDRAHPHP